MPFFILNQTYFWRFDVKAIVLEECVNFLDIVKISFHLPTLAIYF